MQAPSEKKLLEAFRDLTPMDAKLIRKFAKAVDDPDELEELVEVHAPSTETYVRQMHSSPYNSQMWRTTVALHAIGELVGGYGIEALGNKYEYVNMGDTYATTLIFDRVKDRLFVGNWGSIVEAEGDDWEENPHGSIATSRSNNPGEAPTPSHLIRSLKF
jgi:hypothetical protein